MNCPAHSPLITAESISETLKRGQAVDLSSFPRVQRLELINEVLSANSLRQLEGLGDSTQGQIEFVGINAITPDPVRPGAFVTRVDFQCNKPKPEGYNHLAFFNAGATKHSGVIILPIINDEYVLMVQQFRPVIGQTTIEIPRGFVFDLGDPNAVRPYGAALTEMHQETGIDLSKAAHTVLREFTLFENTGTSNIANAVLTIGIKLTAEEFAAIDQRVVADLDNLDQNLKTIIVHRSQLRDFVSDNHTAAALFQGLL